MTPKPTIYIETSVVSYLVSRPSRDAIVRGNQEITRRWWDERLESYDGFVSQYVLGEAADGDPEAARRRLDALMGFKQLTITSEIERLGELYLEEGVLPPKARADAFHVATATVYGIDYLVTWNCRHIASSEARRSISLINRRLKFYEPEIVTPAGLYYENR